MQTTESKLKNQSIPSFLGSDVCQTAGMAGLALRTPECSELEGTYKDDRIAELSGLEGDHPVQHPCQAGSPAADGTGTHPGGFGKCPERETPCLPWAAVPVTLPVFYLIGINTVRHVPALSLTRDSLNDPPCACEHCPNTPELSAWGWGGDELGFIYQLMEPGRCCFSPWYSIVCFVCSVGCNRS